MIMHADVTVIVPVLNGEGTLSRALLSVINQSLAISKIIIVNDNSTDNTQTIINDFQSRFIQRDIEFDSINTLMTLGPGLARNLGIQKTFTKYIAFLDADDSWHEEKIRLQYDFMEKHPEYFMTCHSSLRPQETPAERDRDLNFNKLLFRNIVATRTVMLKSEPKLYFNKGLAEDFELWLSILASNKRACFLSTPIAFHFKQDFSKNGISGRLLEHEVWELRRLIRMFVDYPRHSRIIIAILFSVIKFSRRLAIRFFRTIMQRET